MAILDISVDIARITVMFEQSVPKDLLNSGELTFMVPNLQGGGTLYRISAQHINLPEGARVVPTGYPGRLLSLILPCHDTAMVGFSKDGMMIVAEPITLSSKLLIGSLDPIKLDVTCIQMSERPGHVAAFTQAFNEGDMLLYWESYYAGLVGHENLFVLNNGSTDDSCSRLNKKTTVVNMPGGVVDHNNFAQSQSYFQRFLLQKYCWVIKVDTDEFIACEGDLVETLSDMPIGVYGAGVPLAVIHASDDEAPFDFGRRVCTQRKNFVYEAALKTRPTIASVPVSWAIGNHAAHEGCILLPEFIAVHLRYVDFDMLWMRNERWKAMKQTSMDEALYGGISELKQMTLADTRDFTVKELSDRLSEERVKVPEWLMAKL